MIVVLHPGVSESELATVCDRIRSLGCSPVVAATSERTAIHIEGIPGPEALESLKRLRSIPFVDQVIPLNRPFERVGKKGTSVQVGVGGVVFGGKGVVLIAGPCTVESEEQLFASAEAVARSGAQMLRGGAYKPSTSPYSFHGLGVAALEMLREAGKRFGLKVVTEVMDPRRVELVSEHADMLQIGARNMQNYDLLREAGRSGMPVLLKRGMNARIDEWLLAAEYIATAGSERIVLCERGIRTFETATRNTLDLSAVPAAKSLSGLPVIVDPSHGTGRRDMIGSMSLAAIAAGADGLMIEVHPHPEEALKDGAQSLSTEEFDALVPGMRRVSEAVGRVIAVRQVA